eukprot:g553.t1
MNIDSSMELADSSLSEYDNDNDSLHGPGSRMSYGRVDLSVDVSRVSESNGADTPPPPPPQSVPIAPKSPPSRRAIGRRIMLSPADFTENFDAARASKLRRLVKRALDTASYSGAAFYAGVLVTATGGNPEDVFLLATCHFRNAEYRRAIHLLRRYGLLVPNAQNNMLSLRCIHLAAESHLACGQYDECLELVSNPADDEASSPSTAAATAAGAGAGGAQLDTNASLSAVMKACRAASPEGASLVASIYLAGGKAYEAMDNRVRAREWFKKALQEGDVHCVEAFERLIEHRMLSSVEEADLVLDLPFAADEMWLCLLYQSRLLKNQSAKSIEQRFARLEEECGHAVANENEDVVVFKAECYLNEHDPRKAYELTKWVRQRDPFNLACVSIQLAAMVELDLCSELFHCAHELVDAYPSHPVSWFGVGCYYYAVGKYGTARRYFSKATSLDAHFTPAWLGFGHSLAAQDESDQAMVAYRTAARLFPGSHLPLLSTGMEYLRTNNLNLAEQYFSKSQSMCPSDPLVYNEMGVLFYKQQRWNDSVRCFQQALVLCESLPETLMEVWEPTISNLGHAHRKLGRLDDAKKYYDMALGLSPPAGRKSSLYGSLGMVQQMLGNVETAIECYHKSLSLRPENTFSSEMLKRALEEWINTEKVVPTPPAQ